MHLFGFPLSHKEEENPEMISHTFRKVTEARGEDAKEMWREVMTEQKTLQTLPSLPNPVQNKEKHPQKLIKIKCSLIFYRQRERCLFLEMLTHNMLSQKGSVVCRPFWICCYNSGQASGVMEPKWRWLFNACLSTVWHVGRLLTERSRCIMC